MVGLVVPVIEEEDCVLRPWRLDDVPTVLSASLDPRICAMTTIPSEATREQCEQFVHQQWAYARAGVAYAFAICLPRRGDAPAGYAGLWPLPQDRARAQIGCWVLARYRGAGVATRALAALSAWATEQAGVERLELLVDPADAGLVKIARRIGFSREGKLRNAQQVGRERQDRLLYCRLRKARKPDTPSHDSEPAVTA